MREASVVGLMPSSSAAPPTPKTFPPACSRAAAMLSRSWRFNSSRVNKLAEGCTVLLFLMESADLASASSNCNGPPYERTTARSTAF